MKEDMSIDYKLIEETDIDVLEMLNNTNIDAKEEFINDESLTIPNNLYENLDIDKIDKNIGIIEKRINEGFSDSIEGKVIEKLLHSNMHKNRLVKLCYDYNKGNRSDELINEYINENYCLYGEIDRKSFFAILNMQLDQIKSLGVPDSKQHILDELLDLLPADLDPERELYEPSDEIFVRFGNICKEYLDHILKYVPVKEVYTPQDVCDIANQIFENELSDGGWKAIVKEGKGYASVSQEKRIFNVPGNRSQGEYHYIDVKGILAHEIGVHVLRGYPFRNCPIKALSMGVPGYIRFEEGLATAVQNTIEDKHDPVGHIHYVSIGLATYFKMNFRQIYEIQWRIHDLLGDANKQRCFDSVQRAFRGTGHLVNNKDLAYFEGNKTVWKYIEENIEKDTLINDLWNLGKIDSTDTFWTKTAKYYRC